MGEWKGGHCTLEECFWAAANMQLGRESWYHVQVRDEFGVAGG